MNIQPVYKPKNIRYSSISLYKNCPSCYQIVYVMECDSKGKSDPLMFGTAYHKGLEFYYKGNDFYKGFDVSLFEMEIERKKATEFRTLSKIMFEHYLAFGRLYKASHLEYKFLCPLINPLTKETLKVPLQGTIDMITVDEWLTDHKTSAKEYGEEKLDDPQLHIYSMAYRKLFGHAPNKLVYSVHRKDIKAGRWQEISREPDPVKEAIVFEDIKVTLEMIMMGQFKPKQAPWWFAHHPFCALAKKKK